MTTIDRRQLFRGAAASAAAAAVAKMALVTPTAHAHGGDKKLGEAVSLDNRPFPEYDYSRANKLPRETTGYWEKSFNVGGVTRRAK